MATVTAKAKATHTATVHDVVGDVVTVLNIQPGGLDHYLKMVGADGGNPQFKCFDGRILLASPGQRHQRAGDRLDRLIKEVRRVFRIPFRSYASTMFRVPVEDKGFEPDKSFCIANVDQVRHAREEIDLPTFPPPDLVIESVDWHGPETSLDVCRALRVPEVWIYDARKQSLRFLVFRKTGKFAGTHVASSRSLAFPFLMPADVAPWAADTEEYDDEPLARLHGSVVTRLAPRLEAAKEKGRE
jgi:Uma2 family endonuclease